MYKKKIFILSFLILLVVVFAGCSKKSTKIVTNGVYYWKTVFELDQKDLNWIKENNIQKIYTRFFDVDWNSTEKQALPVGSLRVVTNKIPDIEIIPVVFITNRTFLNIPDSGVSDLALKVFSKIKSQVSEFNHLNIKEIQLDCDWTETTKSKYFDFINSIKRACEKENISLTATIRLHQVKYFKKTGVPPVSRGSLMFYNMSSVSDFETKNSIFNEDIAKKYLVNFDQYPLQLDVILPAFSWGVWFNHNKITGIINDVSFDELNDNSNFKQLKNNSFRVQKSFYFHERYLKANDVIRVEEITPETTLLAAELIAPYIKNDSLVVSIYHLNKKVTKNYDKGAIQDITSAFQ